MAYSLVGIGELLWDVFSNGKELGGAPANFAYHAGAMGGDGTIVSAIGPDTFGEEILDRLESMSLSRDYIKIDKEHPTGTVSVTIDYSGKPTFLIHQNVAWDFIPASPQLMEFARTADAVAFGTLAQRSEVSRNTIQAFVSQVPANSLCIFDINLREPFFSKEVIEWSLNVCNILKLNDEELPVLCEMFSVTGDEWQVLSQLSKQFKLKIIALTKGSKGSILFSKEQVSIHNGYKTGVVDTVGSGDAFTAALAMGLLAGKDLRTINDYANRVASFVCSKRGATPQIPDDFKINNWQNV